MDILGYWDYTECPVVNINGELFVLNEKYWNGEEWHRCWKCKDGYNGKYWELADDTRDYSVRPIYRFQEENPDLAKIEENSQEWERACEIVGYDVRG